VKESDSEKRSHRIESNRIESSRVESIDHRTSAIVFLFWLPLPLPLPLRHYEYS